MEVSEASAAYLTQAGSACPPGYKQTEVGVIPEDWEIKPLGHLVSSVDYGSSTKSGSKGNMPVLRMGNLQGGRIVWDDLVFTDNEYEIKKYLLQSGDVLFNRTNTVDLVGKTSIYAGERPAIFAGYLIRINVEKGLLDSRFLNYVLNTELSRKHSAKVLSVAVGQANINGQKLKTYPIPLPPTKAEQEAIVGALSDADGLIESLEQRIAKKRHLKQGAMQELLTGKKRLPGFSGEWEVKRFGEIAQLRKDRVDPRDTGPFEFCVELEHISQGRGCLVGHTEATENSSLKSVFREEDILFGKLRSYLRKYWLAGKEGVCSTEIWVLVANRFLVLPNYLFQVVRVDRFIEVASTAYGTHMPRSDWNVVRNYEIHLPSIKEQTAIAAILSDMDAEIAALEEKLAKARRIKQGMMQELLTGRIRLVQPAGRVVPLPLQKEPAPTAAKTHNWQINEAVLIGVLAKNFGSEKFPLARKRCTKLTYLLHRHAERRAEGYLKKAAGPYNPATRYKGPEAIARKNGYVRSHDNGTYPGFVAAGKIAEAEAYFLEWYGAEALAWLERFRFRRTEELELLATVDMAMEDLCREGEEVELETVKRVIRDHPEWAAKLEREIFSDLNIAKAMTECRELFGSNEVCRNL